MIHIPMKMIASPLEHTLATTNPREVAALLAEEEEKEERLGNIELREVKEGHKVRATMGRGAA